MSEEYKSQATHEFNESLALTGAMPARFKVIDAIPAAGTMAVVNEKNEHTLRSSLLPNDSVELEDHDELGQYLKRQEAKLDLLLDIVTELLLRQDQYPQELNIKLTAQGVSWQDPELTLASETAMEANLYITASVPRPMRFFGHARSIADGEHFMEFTGISQQVVDLLEKLLFRHHRRAIAQQRGQD